MADKAELMAEAYRRGLLPADKKAAYEEAMRRGIVPRAGRGSADDGARSLGAGLLGGVADIAAGIVSSRGPAMSVNRGDPGQGVLQALAIDLPAAAAEWVGEKVTGRKTGVARAGAKIAKGDSRGALKGAHLDHTPETQIGRVLKTGGEFAPNAAVGGGGVLRRAAAVALPALASEGAAQGVEAIGGNALAQDAARVGGGVLGGLGASVRVAPRGRGNGPLNALANRAPQDPAAMRERANAFEASDIQPTLIDVIDDSGRGVVRATASRMTPARQKATDFRDTRALDLPGRMSRQSRRIMSDDPRTPDQIRAEMRKARKVNADQAYSAVRGEMVDLPPETVTALRSDYARDAIQESARRERDPEIRAMLNRLSGDVLDQPGQTQITVGMADRISRTLRGRADAAARAGDNDLAAILGGLADDVRGPAAKAVTGYGDAVRGYAADSRLVEAAETGEGFLARNTDEFNSSVGRMDDGEVALARAAARRAVERKAGEKVSAAPDVARVIADAPEQQARNRALLGEEDAARLQDAMRLEERTVRNANDIAPRTGPQSQNRAQDAMVVGARVGQQAMRGDWIGMGIDWLRSRGISDKDAQQLTEMAIDPARLPEALAYLEHTRGAAAARQFLEMRNRVLIGSAALSTTAAARPDEDQTR